MTVSRKDTQQAWPPGPDEAETEEERRSRLKSEAEAKKVSELIDRELEQERQRKAKETGGKILLLGQAESGKSTVLKNFQLYFAPKAFEVEAELWRPVIQLNLVRSINFVVTFATSPRSLANRDGPPRRPSTTTVISPELRKLCVRLAPLRQVEDNLIALLSGRPAPVRRRSRSQLRSEDDVEDNALLLNMLKEEKGETQAPEIAFPSNGGWKQKFRRRSEESMDSEMHNSSAKSASSGSVRSSDMSKDGQVRRILSALADDMSMLWGDASVQSLLKKAEIRLEEQPGFFLDQIARVTHEDYTPKPNDILKARVTTIGPEEHIIVSEHSADASKKWTIYDVGGSRSQRAAWAQFFDDVNVIIFLAPMSGFNQVLAEDESINRLTDSLRLWQTICSSKILADVEFVLFLNKLDILDTKLKAGIQFSSFVTSYTGDNEPKPVAKYLLDVFVSLHQQYSPKRRKIHPHLTCAVDTKATASIINRIKDVILVKILSESTLI